MVLQGLKKIGLEVPVAPDGAFYVYIDISSTGMNSMQFCERVLEHAHVALTPGKDFGYSGAEEHVRLSYAASECDLGEALSRLEVFMDQISR
jgi:aspartate/methionine/tyrosine aminotransferase